MSGNDAPIAYEAHEAVATITLDDPERRNALSTHLIAELRRALARAVGDPDVRVIVIDHTGPVFCAGADLKESAAAQTAAELPATHLAEALADIAEAPKPVIVLARGAARGGGLGLIAAADFAIGLGEAEFAFSEVRLGVVPAVIAPVVMRRIGPARTRELFLVGGGLVIDFADCFTGADAEEWGLLTFASPENFFKACVDDLVHRLKMGGPAAQAGIKVLTATPGLRGQLRAEAARTAEFFFSEEGREGVRSFLGKRPPSWVGLAAPTDLIGVPLASSPRFDLPVPGRGRGRLH
ncbi:enoyl-CoA hydratase-related protein [Glycomyces harbinensis]|uniref:Methylglutaconyl-CoA hydratase n=1 Tax=Glycomyces harbinensis TaxID=58114 RepID=A0A1G7DW58_9ACTN|nr:enoyl-CoA hydratase-related protein [Glycomyces harbinensis]SDE55681.1 methylglutaconyl-CoA hydratase [Glycomyces harbinensis]